MLKIRLSRMGSRHRPFYRVVVSDSHRVPRSTALDEIGYYDPRPRPSVVSIDLDRVDHWMGLGAKPSETVLRLIRKARVNGATTPVVAEAAPAVPAEVVAEAVVEPTAEVAGS